MPDSQRRRLAAILAADIAGYSALMGADEARTVRELRGHQAVVLPMIGEFGGRVIDTAGDGILAEFPSVVNAVECAVAIQSKMGERNAATEPGRRMLFRMGINLGDVIFEGDRIFGDGINVAARLEGIAEAGGICVSGKVHEEIRGRLRLDFEDLGDRTLKNIVQPVRTYRIVPGNGAPHPAGVSASAPAALALPAKPSIAVLPFDNISGDPEQEYFADGMVEDITTGLSRFKWLFVIARNSTFAYKGKRIDIKQAGRELGVRYLLEGSVRKATGRVRITTQLLEAEGGTHVWAERYDRAIDDIFAVQDEITVSTVAAIEPSLRQAEIERAKRKRPENLDAYDLVLRATPLSDTGMPEGVLEALPLLESALALDPNYALAHGRAAYCHEVLYVRAGRRAENYEAAIRHGHAAIALGPDDATALVLGGIAIGMVEHDRDLAQEAFEAALALSPSAASAYLWGSLILGWGGKAEHAIEWGERGARLSPFDPWITAALHGICLGHFLRGRHDEAVSAARRSIRSKPGFSISHMMLAAALASAGRLDEAKAAAQRVLALQPNFRVGVQLSAVGAVPELAASMAGSLRRAGLPE